MVSNIDKKIFFTISCFLPLFSVFRGVTNNNDFILFLPYLLIIFISIFFLINNDLKFFLKSAVLIFSIIIFYIIFLFYKPINISVLIFIILFISFLIFFKTYFQKKKKIYLLDVLVFIFFIGGYLNSFEYDFDNVRFINSLFEFRYYIINSIFYFFARLYLNSKRDVIIFIFIFIISSIFSYLYLFFEIQFLHYTNDLDSLSWFYGGLGKNHFPDSLINSNVYLFSKYHPLGAQYSRLMTGYWNVSFYIFLIVLFFYFKDKIYNKYLYLFLQACLLLLPIFFLWSSKTIIISYIISVFILSIFLYQKIYKIIYFNFIYIILVIVISHNIGLPNLKKNLYGQLSTFIERQPLRDLDVTELICAVAANPDCSLQKIQNNIIFDLSKTIPNDNSSISLDFNKNMDLNFSLIISSINYNKWKYQPSKLVFTYVNNDIDFNDEISIHLFDQVSDERYICNFKIDPNIDFRQNCPEELLIDKNMSLKLSYEDNKTYLNFSKNFGNYKLYLIKDIFPLAINSYQFQLFNSDNEKNYKIFINPKLNKSYYECSIDIKVFNQHFVDYSHCYLDNFKDYNILSSNTQYIKINKDSYDNFFINNTIYQNITDNPFRDYFKYLTLDVKKNLAQDIKESKNIDEKVDKFSAVHSLVGGSISEDAGVFTYHDGQTSPTEEEIKTEQDRLQAEYDAQYYEVTKKKWTDKKLWTDIALGKGVTKNKWTDDFFKTKLIEDTFGINVDFSEEILSSSKFNYVSTAADVPYFSFIIIYGLFLFILFLAIIFYSLLISYFNYLNYANYLKISSIYLLVIIFSSFIVTFHATIFFKISTAFLIFCFIGLSSNLRYESDNFKN